MGYFIQGMDIANNTVKPAKVSLAGNANYIQFDAKIATENKPVEIQLKIWNSGWLYIRPGGHGINEYENVSAFSIIESESGKEHKFRGTSDESEPNEPGVFFLGEFSQYSGSAWEYERHRTTLSLKECLEKNEFLKNFDISISEEDNTVINIKAKGYSKRYAFWFVFGENSLGQERSFFNVIGDSTETYLAGTDLISFGYDNTEVHLDLYKDTGVFLGEDDTPSDKNMGTHAITLTKAYSNAPAWFNLNILNKDQIPTTFLDADDWVNTGTIHDFRFSAGRVIANKYSSTKTLFYHSPALYTLAGYTRTLEKNDLSEYIFDTQERLKTPEERKLARPLTNQPELFHIKGQTQYFNFILSDAEHSKDLSQEYQIGLHYELLSQSGRAIAKVNKHLKNRTDFSMVNTIRLDIDSLLEQYPNAGIVKVYLVCLYPDAEPLQVSQPLSYRILPECLHKVNDFAFLNRLGGWSSFNFSGMEQTDFKAEANTIFRTQLPTFSTQSEIESVYSKQVTEQFVVQSMPVTRQVCDWLKELSASRKVYELATRRYVIVDEMNIKPNSKDELFRIEMKYHYSDSYNG